MKSFLTEENLVITVPADVLAQSHVPPYQLKLAQISLFNFINHSSLNSEDKFLPIFFCIIYKNA